MLRLRTHLIYLEDTEINTGTIIDVPNPSLGNTTGSLLAEEAEEGLDRAQNPMLFSNYKLRYEWFASYSKEIFSS